MKLRSWVRDRVGLISSKTPEVFFPEKDSGPVSRWKSSNDRENAPACALETQTGTEPETVDLAVARQPAIQRDDAWSIGAKHLANGLAGYGSGDRHRLAATYEDMPSPVSYQSSQKKPSAKQKRKKHKDVGLLSIKIEKKARIIRGISVLMSSGTTLGSAISIMINQESEDRVLRNFLKNLSMKIESGSPLSEAIASSKVRFNGSEIAMIRVGESIGALAETLDRMANLMDKKIHLGKKITSAMFYPLTVMIISSVVALLLTGIVIPKFEKIIEDQIGPRAMPALTSVIIKGSRWISSYWKEFLMTGMVVLALSCSLKRLGFVKNIFYRILLKIPLVGDGMVKWNLVVFARTFGDLLLCGLPVIDAMRLSSAGVGNFVMRAKLELTILDLQQGLSLSDSIHRRGIFPAMVEGLIRVGEESGQLGAMMISIANNCENDLDEVIARISSTLEPILVVILSLFVGTIVIGLFMPLITLIQGIAP